MLADIGQYIFDLADNWAAFVTGGILAALVSILERYRRDQVPLRTFVVFLVFGFVAASFATWRHEHIAKLAFEQISQRSRNPDVTQHLQDYYAEAYSLHSDALNSKSDADFDAVRKSADEWATGMGHWIVDNMGNGAYVKLIQTPPPPRPDVKPERVSTIMMLALIRDGLEKLVENPAWDRPTNAIQVTKPATSP